MSTLVDTSVWVSAALGTEALSAKAAAAIEACVEPTVDTTIALETFLVLRSKRGVEVAADALQRILASYAYAPVARTTLARGAVRARRGELPIGDAVIVENALRQGARLLTLDKRQAEATGGSATLIKE